MILIGEIDRIYTKLINKNSLFGMTQRVSGLNSESDIHIMADTETINLNLFSFEGTIEILNFWAEVTAVIACTNMTNVYIDIWDGTNSKVLSKTGADFSGLTVGSFFIKSETIDNKLLLHIASENRVTEPTAKKSAQTVLITAKNGVTNYLRLNFTTNTTLDLTLKLFLEYKLLNGSNLELV